MLLVSALLFGLCGVRGGDVFDFTQFEDSLLPQWVSLFALNKTSFSFTPGGGPSSMYGSADIAHALFTTGVLDSNYTLAEREEWANVLRSFQNSSGYFAPDAPVGFQPWHAGAFGPAALKLLGPYPPTYKMKYAEAIMGGGEAIWNATFLPLLDPHGPHPSSIWDAAHKIAGIPASMLGFNSSAIYTDFFEWYFGPYLGKHADPKSGYWCENPDWAPPHVQCLGGAFHLFFVYRWLSRDFPFPNASLASSASLQNPTTGLWGSYPPNYIDLDGLYGVTRSAAQVGQAGGAVVQKACNAYLASAHKALTDPSIVIHGAYAADTHNLPAAVAGVAECAKWLPHSVVTKRPWKFPLDYAPFI